MIKPDSEYNRILIKAYEESPEYKAAYEEGWSAFLASILNMQTTVEKPVVVTEPVYIEKPKKIEIAKLVVKNNWREGLADYEVFPAMIKEVNKIYTYEQIAITLGNITPNSVNAWGLSQTLPRGADKKERVANVFSSVYKKITRLSYDEVMQAICDAEAHIKDARQKSIDYYNSQFGIANIKADDWTDFGFAISKACKEEGVSSVEELLSYLHSYNINTFTCPSQFYMQAIKPQRGMGAVGAERTAEAIKKVLSNSNEDWVKLLNLSAE